MVSLTLFECCLRLLRHAPESSLNITLPPLRPYREPGSLAQSLPEAIPVSAGVSRKRVHLFRWRSYFHKAFTGAKKTTSRERLPNPSLPRWTMAAQATGSRVSRITRFHRQSLTIHRPHFLMLSPEPRRPCTSHHQVIARETARVAPHATRVRPLRCSTTSHHRGNKEHDYGPTHCRPAGY